MIKARKQTTCFRNAKFFQIFNIMPDSPSPMPAMLFQCWPVVFVGNDIVI